MFRQLYRHAAVISLLATVAAWILSSAGLPAGIRQKSGSRMPRGVPQLVSIEPLPAVDGEICQWSPASQSPDRKGGGIDGTGNREQGTEIPHPEFRIPAPETQHPTPGTQDRALALAALTSVAPAEDKPRTSVSADRAPLRIIRDTYPAYSAVAVDPKSNEVFLQDENLTGIKVFNRLDNTPPSANFTEPKRVLAGLKTKMEFNCGLYIDPHNGEIYSVNNDTGETLVIFPHDAKGDVEPIRELHTPHGTYGIAVDEASQELFMTVEHSNQIVVYRKMAQKNDPPLRVLRGDSTKLGDPHGIALDAEKQWMFVSNYGNSHTEEKPPVGVFRPPSITVYPLKASGNTAPLRVIAGPKTKLDWPAHMALDAPRGELFVADDNLDAVLVFRETDSGDAAPARVIQGPQTGLKNPVGIYLDPKNQEVWIANMGNHSATVYSITADGDVAPLRTIRSSPAGQPTLNIGNPGAVGFDSKREQILVPN